MNFASPPASPRIRRRPGATLLGARLASPLSAGDLDALAVSTASRDIYDSFAPAHAFYAGEILLVGEMLAAEAAS